MLEFRTISRVARVLMGMNQRQLGKALGIAMEAVSCWERGVSMPTEKHRKDFEALCAKRGVGFMANGMPVLIENHLRAMAAYEQRAEVA